MLPFQSGGIPFGRMLSAWMDGWLWSVDWCGFAVALASFACSAYCCCRSFHFNDDVMNLRHSVMIGMRDKIQIYPNKSNQRE